eukprot:TRINITY_DN4422_c0_g1_i1.p1 TRINITY_DN4422_c0_g1~~TRINITY_DN4422_c0_g1_i1.p1  ORF type:complete len:577 (+),score=139.60 TRINITY_DN4422_c0_g1_i1:224-1954(+)
MEAPQTTTRPHRADTLDMIFDPNGSNSSASSSANTGESGASTSGGSSAPATVSGQFASNSEDFYESKSRLFPRPPSISMFPLSSSPFAPYYPFMTGDLASNQSPAVFGVNPHSGTFSPSPYLATSSSAYASPFPLFDSRTPTLSPSPYFSTSMSNPTLNSAAKHDSAADSIQISAPFPVKSSNRAMSLLSSISQSDPSEILKPTYHPLLQCPTPPIPTSSTPSSLKSSGSGDLEQMQMQLQRQLMDQQQQMNQRNQQQQQQQMMFNIPIHNSTQQFQIQQDHYQAMSKSQESQLAGKGKRQGDSNRAAKGSGGFTFETPHKRQRTSNGSTEMGNNAGGSAGNSPGDDSEDLSQNGNVGANNGQSPNPSTPDSGMSGSQSAKKRRGSYKCGRCGVPKKGHNCDTNSGTININMQIPGMPPSQIPGNHSESAPYMMEAASPTIFRNAPPPPPQYGQSYSISDSDRFRLVSHLRALEGNNSQLMRQNMQLEMVLLQMSAQNPAMDEYVQQQSATTQYMMHQVQHHQMQHQQMQQHQQYMVMNDPQMHNHIQMHHQSLMNGSKNSPGYSQSSRKNKQIKV